MNIKLLTCLSVVLMGFFLGACSDDLKESKEPQILIAHSGSLVTKESGATATFSMALSDAPKRKVIINIVSSDLSEGLVEPSVVIIDDSNWFVSTVFTITGLRDDIVDGDIDYKIRLAEKADPNIAHPLEAVELAVKNLDIDRDVDPDPALFELSTTEILTREDGPAVEFGLVLKSKPAADVVIALHVSDESEGSLSPNVLSFSPANWQDVQVVAVNPLADGIVDGDQYYVIEFGVLSADKRYEAYKIDALKVKNIDVDSPTSASFVLSTTQILTREDGAAVDFSLALGSKPTSDVVVALHVSDESEGSIDKKTLSFSPENWQAAQVVKLSPQADGIVDGDQDYVIDFGVSSADKRYEAYKIDALKVKNIDVDSPALATFNLSTTQLQTREGGPAVDFSLALGSKPTATVAVVLQVSDDSEGSLSPNVLSFSPENWQAAQTVKVNPLADGIVDGDQNYVISFAVSSTDVRYNAYKILPINVKNVDVDVAIAASFNLSATKLLTSEGGPAVDFRLALGSKPTATVAVTLQVSDTSEGSLSQNVLSFSPENWQAEQIVKVNPLADGIVDGDQNYLISFGVTSADARYHNYKIGPIQVTNIDVDLPPASFKLSLTKLVTRENGPATSFSLSLGSKPMADVVVDLYVSDGSEGSINKNRLSFTSVNWQQVQTVTVTPLADGIVDGDQNYVIEFDVSSTDARYHGYKLGPVNVTNVDVDYPAGSGIPIRVVAANITSGSDQSYDPGHGIRIFQALKPDIVMIQEFNMKNSSLRAMVTQAFGAEFYYTVGYGAIPNGIISRFPIVASGAWDALAPNRDWDWAVIDIPGEKDILVVSVHLLINGHNDEMPLLKEKIQAKVGDGKYYVLLGGDFNTTSRTNTEITFTPLLQVEAPYPVDQNGQSGTNAARKNPYDWVLCCPAWAKFEVPVVIGSRSYPHGHVFDSRVYSSHGELGDVEPVLWNDSGSLNMQHMAIVRDFVFRY